jgi:hypothetical protein
VPFLESEVDLQGTMFGANDLAVARSVWRDVFARVAPNWPSCPRGGLAARWNDVSTTSGCQLIWIAQVIWKLSRALTARSVSAFHDKMRDLLQLEGLQFEELLTELEVAAGLSERVSPVSFEPLVKDPSKKEQKSYSPDYAFRLPDGDVLVEVTVLRIGAFDRWNKEAKALTEYLRARWARDGLLRSVEFELPLSFQFHTLGKHATHALARKVVRTREGMAQLVPGSNLGNVRWSEMTPSSSEAGSTIQLGRCSLAITHGHLQTALHLSLKALLLEAGEVTDIVLGSLRNTLDYKLRKWGKREAPYVLAMALGHPWLNSEGVTRAVAERIMSNRKYRRLSGFLRYTPPTGFSKSDRLHDLFLLVNESALFPVGSHVWSLFEGKAQFHLP